MQVYVIDGGSTDGTPEVVNQFMNSCDGGDFEVRFRESNTKGRAAQMNLGAELAFQENGSEQNHVLYFLHADSFPPKDFDQMILNAVDQGHPAGCFRMRFNSTNWWLRFTGWLTRFEWKAARGGDQSQYITASLFEEIGGYDENYPIYEDYQLIRELYSRSIYHVIPAQLMTSARRYEEKGVFKLQWFYLNIYWRKFMGADAQELYRYYQRWCD
jgi:rSAM/selenodomain-associated transferase 2